MNVEPERDELVEQSLLEVAAETVGAAGERMVGIPQRSHAEHAGMVGGGENGTREKREESVPCRRTIVSCGDDDEESGRCGGGDGVVDRGLVHVASSEGKYGYGAMSASVLERATDGGCLDFFMRGLGWSYPRCDPRPSMR